LVGQPIKRLLRENSALKRANGMETDQSPGPIQPDENNKAKNCEGSHDQQANDDTNNPFRSCTHITPPDKFQCL